MKFDFDNRLVGDGAPCYVIAEIGNNHNGDPDKAELLIRAAAKTGADAVKFQTFKARDIHNPLIAANAYPGFDVSHKFNTWVEYVETTELDYKHYPRLYQVANECGVQFLSTPASLEAVGMLDQLGIPAFKIASMDLINKPLLDACANSGKPIILSTGMSQLADIDQAVKDLNNSSIAVLHCVSNYPTTDSDVRLFNMNMLAKRYPHVVPGFSSHCSGEEIEIAAVALGAKIIEKHFTLDVNDPDPAEHHVSISQDSFRYMVSAIRRVEAAFGDEERILTSEEQKNAKLARRSLVVNRDLKASEIVEDKDIALIRPGTGIPPRHLEEVSGRKLARNIDAWQALQWEDLV